MKELCKDKDKHILVYWDTLEQLACSITWRKASCCAAPVAIPHKQIQLSQEGIISNQVGTVIYQAHYIAMPQFPLGQRTLQVLYLDIQQCYTAQMGRVKPSIVKLQQKNHKQLHGRGKTPCTLVLGLPYKEIKESNTGESYFVPQHCSHSRCHVHTSMK